MNILFIITSAFIAGSLITLLFIDKKVIKNIRKPKNKVHFYVARDNDDRLFLYIGKPIKTGYVFSVPIYKGYIPLKGQYEFKYFGLNEHDYDNLKWEDEPVEVFLNMEE